MKLKYIQRGKKKYHLNRIWIAYAKSAKLTIKRTGSTKPRHKKNLTLVITKGNRWPFETSEIWRNDKEPSPLGVFFLEFSTPHDFSPLLFFFLSCAEPSNSMIRKHPSCIVRDTIQVLCRMTFSHFCFSCVLSLILFFSLLFFFFIFYDIFLRLYV